MMGKRLVEVRCEECGEVSTFTNTEPELARCFECCTMDAQTLQGLLWHEVRPERGDEPPDVDKIKAMAIDLVIAEKHRRYLAERLVE